MGGLLSSVSTLQTSFLQTGDLLLISCPKATSFGLAPPDLVRGLMAAQKGTLATEEEKLFCNTWTLAAMVYRVPRDRAEQALLGDPTKDKDKEKKRTDPYVIFANGKGIYVQSAREFVNDMTTKGGTVVCRPLTVCGDGLPSKTWLNRVDQFYTMIVRCPGRFKEKIRKPVGP